MLKRISFSAIVFIFISIVNWFLMTFSIYKKGISGHMRVRNEEESIETCIESVIDFLDEIVITYNNCSDNSVQVIKKMQEKYPKKIRSYEWKKEPVIISDYSNFGLKKCKYRWVLKLDADLVFNIPSNSREKILNSKQTIVHVLGGICPFFYNNSLGFLKEKKTIVEDDNLKKHTITNMSEETRIFVKTFFNKYKRDKKTYWEWHRIPLLRRKDEYFGDCFVHLIYLKRHLIPNVNELISYEEINKDNVYKYFDNNFNWGLLDLFKNNTIQKIANKYKYNRHDFWYELKQKDWNGKEI